MAHEDAAKTKKIEVVVVTLSGEYSHKYDGDTLIEAVVQEAIKHLKLVADNTWVLELDGQSISQAQTLEAAGIKSGDELEFHAPEGGGGSHS